MASCSIVQTTNQAPSKDAADDWKVGLIIDGDRLTQFIGGGDGCGKTFAAIKKTGGYLLSVRTLIHQIEKDGIENDHTEEEEDDNCFNHTTRAESTVIFDKLLESLSLMFRSPAVRFFNTHIGMSKQVLRAVQMWAPKNYNELPWSKAQYNAVVTYSFSCQIAWNLERKEHLADDAIRSMLACLEARPEDATMRVSLGNFLMVTGDFRAAVKCLEKALELDEANCYGSHYTIANIYGNLMPTIDKHTVHSMDVLDRMHAIESNKQVCKHLERYLELAEDAHWHTARACFSLVLQNACRLARGVEGCESIEQRNPGFCKQSLTWYNRGVTCLRLYENNYGREESDCMSIYKQAASMISRMSKSGCVDVAAVVDGEYICSFPSCTQSHRSESPLDKCSKCLTRRYCSRTCQVQHWKGGHKQECSRLAKESQERLRANPHRMERPQMPAVSPSNS